MSNRFIRLIKAPKYLGMKKTLFEEIVRPFVPSIQMGKRGIAFDRKDLDKWADDYKERNVRAPNQKQVKPWHDKTYQVSKKSEPACGKLIKYSEFAPTLSPSEFSERLKKAAE